ncbi:uncharacterized protein LOC133630604 [Entelurus aequoreus]|uniref:uncharacterized protein LOC133630604 n=1 Tax=Entelurus aequoreus TaxID=161455 RepID=UPI002B1CE9FC|nr:uncharacterized protein LOC133630604 [Entelurus aequoreus]
MDFRPLFVFHGFSTELTLERTAEATKVGKNKLSVACVVQKGEEVKEEARARIRQSGGDPGCAKLVLSESKLQFGQYRGQTFKWLLGNDVGYACSIVVLHQKERDSGDTSQSPLAVNKTALASYVRLFPDMVAALRSQAVLMEETPFRELDGRAVGFGAHAKSTYSTLYESPNGDDQSYLQWLRGKQTKPGSTMHAFQRYVLKRDKDAQTQTAPGPDTHGKCSPQVCLTFFTGEEEPTDATTDAMLLEPTDAMLLEAAMEAESQPSTSQTMRTPLEADPSCLTAPITGDGAASPLTSGAELLPESWRQTLPEDQHDWVGRALFVRDPKGKAVLKSGLQLWWQPPQKLPYYTEPPASSAVFFHSRFFLWCPYKLWGCKLECPNCKHKLTGCGLYKTLRTVLDLSDWYYMATEYLECHACHKKYAAWASNIVGQLSTANQAEFPAILTYKLSCDKKVIWQMQARTQGNSATRLRSHLVMVHSREWHTRALEYLEVMDRFHSVGSSPLPRSCIPHMRPLPSVSLLLSVYVREVLPRMEHTKARITSTFGSILKMDSTKKMTKKLAGETAGTAAWVTNVGNELGQVLMSVVTAAEGDGLLAMAQGLMRRYREAGRDPPQVLYVNRDCCCSAAGQPKVAATFGEWDRLVVRLDVWHLMRRFARGVSTEAHMLYGEFMNRLSFAMFEWDEGDVRRLSEAKRAEHGGNAHVKLSSKELHRHCRRRTRGAEETTRLVQEVLDHLWDAKNTMGVKLFDQDRMKDIWSTQRRHLGCIQDPPGVALYTRTSTVTRGGVALPVFRCARGSTSLESFHLHLCRFIPGTSASDLLFQVYLLEGLCRWNEDRGRAAVKGADAVTVQCYDTGLQDALARLTQEYMGVTLVDNYTPASKYTGELIGIQYLYAQTGAVLQSHAVDDPDQPDDSADLKDEQEDEDQLEDDEGYDDAPVGVEQYPGLFFPPDDEPAEEKEEEDVLGPDGNGGYQHVCRLATALVALRRQMSVQPRQERHVIELWQKLTDGDKTPLSLPPRHAPKLNKRRFKVSRQHHLEVVASVKRLYIGQGAEVAHSPDSSRLMEAVFIQLSSHHSQEHNISGFRQSRWSLIMRDYTRIRENLSSNQAIKAAGCSICLLEVNYRTLTQWFNKRCKDMATADVVVATVPAQGAAATTTQSLPAARELMVDIAQPHDAHDYQHPAHTSGLACTRRGPVVPELYHAVVAAAASTSAAAAAPPSSSAAAPPPPSYSVAAAPPSGSTTRIPRSTAWYRKKKALSLGGIMDIDDLKRTETFKCKLCGQPKNKEHGHSRYRNETFCAHSQGRSVEEWLAEKRSQDTQRQRQTQHTRATQPLAFPVPNPQTPVPNPQTPVPNPQTPVPNPQTPVPNPYAHSMLLLRKILPKPPP